MRMFLADRYRAMVARAALVLTAWVLGSIPLAAQTPREVVSKTVSVGRNTAALELEFDAGADLAITLADGEVRIDGSRVGQFEPGDALDVAWRSLLGFAVALDDGALARALSDWTPAADMPSESAALAERIDDALEAAFDADGPTGREAVADEQPSTGGEAIALRSLIALLDRTDGFAGLTEALTDLDLDGARIAVGEDLTIGEDEVVEGTVLVVDGDLEIAGRVRGDVVVVDGDVRLAPGARIDGDLRYLEGRVIDQGGEVDGDIMRIEFGERDIERRIRDEVRSEIRSEIRAATRNEDRSDRGTSPFRRIFGGLGGAIANLFTVLVLGVVGAVVVHFAGPNLDAVAETARRTPGRALMVGTAGAFLILPAFVLGIVALAISIIGIPALILWIPLFPVAVVLGGGLGYLAVGRNVGIWLTGQRFPYLGWVRITNPVTLILGGALALMAPFIAAELVSVFPWTGALEVLLVVTGTLMATLAVLLGFGAVLLTRAGRRPEFYDDDLFGGWGTGRPRPSPRPDPTHGGEGAAWTEPAVEEPSGPAANASTAEPAHDASGSPSDGDDEPPEGDDV